MKIEDIKDKIIEAINKKRLPNVIYSKSHHNNKYFQIGLYKNNEKLKLKNLHFEILSTKEPNKFRFEIHFEEQDTTRYYNNENLKNIVNENNEYEFFEWWTKNKNPNNKSIRYKEHIEINDDSDIETLINIIFITYDIFNDILVEIYSNKSQNKDKDMKNQPLNQILYGPPGTGKTYESINKALEIIFEKEDKDKKIQFTFQGEKLNKKSIKEIKEILYKETKDSKDRKILKIAFEYYKEIGQIEFITFHQSYGYEEFVEGIKAETTENGIEYKVEDGIFKKICKRAQYSDNFEEIYQKFLDTFDEDEEKEFTTLKKGRKFKVRINSKKNLTLLLGKDAKEQGTLTKEALKNISDWESYSQPIYKKLEELGLKIEDNSNKNYILIIDEINRGNISKIFGELITLIESSKRIGKDEEIRVKLPYSEELFGVPSNLYILGTMNTADRSIAQIDTALRRRFEFVEMMPKPKLLENIIIKADDKEIKVQKIIEAINERIEYIYDREHTIGHSYFMPLIETPTKEKLDEIFRVNIIPLLAEYFYGDWEDIIFVLNNNFIKEKNKPTYKLNTTKQLNKVYEINYEDKDKQTFSVDGYKNIYEQEAISNTDDRA